MLGKNQNVNVLTTTKGSMTVRAGAVMVLPVLSDPSISLSSESKDSKYSEKVFHLVLLCE